MMTPRLVWSVLWLGAVAGFALSYWRVERARKRAEDDSLRGRLRNWAAWQPWRERIMREEFEVSE